MAIKYDIINSITDVNTSWEGTTGAEVEDFICRRLAKPVASMSYSNTTLTLFNQEGDVITSTPITVAEANYDYSIVFYGLRVNGEIHTGPELLMLYKEGTVVEAGIAIRSVASVLDNTSDNNGRFKISFEFNGLRCDGYARNISKDYFQLLGNDFILNPDIDASKVVAWVDISTLFKKRSTGNKVTVSFIPPEKERLLATLEMVITNEVINLLYNGDVVISQNSVQVQFENDTNFQKYNLIVFKNNTGPITIEGSGEIEGLEPGLNQIVVRAEHQLDKSICTNWLNFDIIYTNNFQGTAIAVNGVSSGITNNGVATLYKMCIYSTSREEVELTTYLENNIPDSNNPEPTEVIKSEFIQASSYNRDTNTTDEISYKKYIEVESLDSTKYLLIKCNGVFYQFKTPSYSSLIGYSCENYPYIQMDVEKCNMDYVYIKKYNISKNYDQITGQINNLFSTDLQLENATLISDLESSDGWKEKDGITYLKLSKQGKDVLKNGIDLLLNDNFTIEMGFRTYNISDKSQSILNIGKLTLFPTQLGWDYNDGITSTNFLKRNAQFQEDLDTHIIVTVTKDWTITKEDPYYPDYLGSTSLPTFDAKAPNTTINLMRIYINGCIDREVVLENTELQELKRSLLQINPKSADIDLYLFRVYNSLPLTHREVIQNYISFLPLKTGDLSKESIFNKNDILDESGKISWSKCLGKVNTLLFIYHDGGRFPNRFWGQEDNKSSNNLNKKIPCTLIVNYADPIKNAKYGGILDKLQCKGLGSSAMRYLIWNVNSSLNKFKYKVDGKEKKAKSKFKPFGKLWIDENRPDLMPTGTSDTYNEIEGYYSMPTYDGEKDTTDYKYTKMVGKVNFASSMQSHKIGACKLYDDAYKNSLGTESLPSRGKKAVHEEPFMYFYIETDIPFDKNDKWSSELDCNNITYNKILELGDQAKFMGFLTWGPGKGDDACSGFDENITPHYLMLEGGENTDPSVNFQRPWQALLRLKKEFVRDGTKYKYGVDNTDLKEYPTVNKEESLADPSAQLLIDDESIVYMNRGAWDIDYGFEEEKHGDTVYYNIPEGGSRESLKVFREFYDNVYKWDFTCVWVKSTITEPQRDWSQNKKYCVLSNKFNINERPITEHQVGDVYRFDEPSNSWVPAGVYYNNGWERLNFADEIKKETGITVSVSSENNIKAYLKVLFKNKMDKLLHVNDIAFHQAFVKFLSGTDNRAKNTYFLIIGPLYHEVNKIGEDGLPIVNEFGEIQTEFVLSGEGDNLIRLIGDDLDTILVTDNNGLQSKPYNLIEDSYDESFYDHWGDVGNLFFRMFDTTYESNIKSLLTKIMDTAALKPSSVNDKSSYFYKLFFKVQEDFPEIAFNNTATIYYENALIIKNSTGGQSIYGFNYTNNDVQPIEQSHGSCLQGEKQFMKERVAFLAGYAGTVTGLDNDLSTASSAGGGKALKMKLDFIPVLDFYPTYQYEKGVIKPIGEYADSNFDIIKYKAVAGQYYEQVIDESKSAINLNLFLVNLYKQLSLTGLLVNDVNGNLASTTNLTIDNDIITSNQDFFGNDYPTLNLALFSANLPVVERLTLRNLPLPSELNLENYLKLQTLDLTGSHVNNVIFPLTGLLREIILPASIKTFEIYNNPNLSTVTFENTENLETIYIDSTKCKLFNVAEFCENLNAMSLSSVSIKNLRNVYLTEEALYKLLVNKCDLTGEITIVDTFGSITPKLISFKTKQDLVNLFGDIVSGTNGLKINFTESTIEQFTCNSEVNAFYDSKKGGSQTFSNLYNIQVELGNDVAIIKSENPFKPSVVGYLDITYSLNKSVTNVSINNQTGTITLTGNATEATVKITMKTNKGYSLTQEVRIVFKWSAPKIGDFAYIDGTFSSYYNSSKTLAGLVYAKTGDNTSGTVYIIGKEYANIAQYSGYSTQSMNSNTGETSIPYYIYLTNQFKNDSRNGLGIITSYQPENVVLGSSYPLADSNMNINNIDYSKSDKIDKLTMNGKDDTKQYVDLVNNTLLRPLKSKDNYKEFIEFTGSNYYIKDMNTLNALCEELELDSVGSKFDAGLLYPYFYSAYLYQPTIKNGETIDSLYKKGKWYMPSIGELSRIIYYRGYSSGGSSFLSLACRLEIKDVASGNTPYTIPIFSLALKAMGLYNFPSVWNNIVGSGNSGTVNNITTTVSGLNEEADNYSYQVKESYTDSGTTYTSEWMIGLYSEYNYYGTGYINGWRYTKHQGIPFVQYDYTDPSNQSS